MRDNGGHVRVWHIASFRCAALRNLVAIGHSGLWRVISRGPGAPKNVDRTGRPSITKTETLRSANPPQMPKGLMCKLGQHGREYGVRDLVGSIRHAAAPPFAAIAGAVLYGRAASRRPGQTFRLNHNSGSVCPACMFLRVAYFGQHPKRFGSRQNIFACPSS
jgi:hypothetical protein